MEHTAVDGETYGLPCRPNTTVNADVRWFFRSSVLGNRAISVYEFGRVRDEFQARFSLDTSVPGLFGLNISDVQLNDTGNYTCIDDNDLGDHYIHHLTVVRKLPMNRLHCVSKNAPTLASCSLDNHGLMLIVFDTQHQQTFRNDVHIQLSLSLHFYLLYLLLNGCDGNDVKHNVFSSVDCWWWF